MAVVPLVQEQSLRIARAETDFQPHPVLHDKKGILRRNPGEAQGKWLGFSSRVQLFPPDRHAFPEQGLPPGLGQRPGGLRQPAPRKNLDDQPGIPVSLAVKEAKSGFFAESQRFPLSFCRIQ